VYAQADQSKNHGAADIIGEHVFKEMSHVKRTPVTERSENQANEAQIYHLNRDETGGARKNRTFDLSIISAVQGKVVTSKITFTPWSDHELTDRNKP
jgi:hypothetical protein